MRSESAITHLKFRIRYPKIREYVMITFRLFWVIHFLLNTNKSIEKETKISNGATYNAQIINSKGNSETSGITEKAMIMLKHNHEKNTM